MLVKTRNKQTKNQLISSISSTERSYTNKNFNLQDNIYRHKLVREESYNEELDATINLPAPKFQYGLISPTYETIKANSFSNFNLSSNISQYIDNNSTDKPDLV